MMEYFTRTTKTKDLPSGLYFVHWNNRQITKACIGCFHDSSRWIICSNWTVPSTDMLNAEPLEKFWDDINWLESIDHT